MTMLQILGTFRDFEVKINIPNQNGQVSPRDYRRAHIRMASTRWGPHVHVEIQN